MAGEDTEKDRGFRVQDRRRFTATGEPREEDAGRESDAGTCGREAPETEERPDAGHRAAEAGEPPQMTFGTLVMSLSTQALAHLGEIPDPLDRQVRVDLAQARQVIDILAVLEEKTRGNLDPAEKALLESVLYDLRMKFVERSRRRSA